MLVGFLQAINCDLIIGYPYYLKYSIYPGCYKMMVSNSEKSYSLRYLPEPKNIYQKIHLSSILRCSHKPEPPTIKKHYVLREKLSLFPRKSDMEYKTFVSSIIIKYGYQKLFCLKKYESNLIPPCYCLSLQKLTLRGLEFTSILVKIIVR